jgi:ATP-dependent Clp protease ATP-binding subunit ClpA
MVSLSPALGIFLVALLLFGARRLARDVDAKGVPREIAEIDPAGVISIEGRRVLIGAGQEMQALNHDTIGPVHLLMALTGQPDAFVAVILQHFGLDQQTVRWRMKEMLVLGDADRRTTRLPFTLGAIEAVGLAKAEATALGHVEVGPVHLLIGVLRVGGEASDILTGLGMSLDEARKALARTAADSSPMLSARANPQRTPLRDP